MELKKTFFFCALLGILLNNIAGNEQGTEQVNGARIPYKPCFGMFCNHILTDKKNEATEPEVLTKNSGREKGFAGILRNLYHELAENRVSQTRYRPCVYKICSHPLMRTKAKENGTFLIKKVKNFFHDLLKTENSYRFNQRRPCIGKSCMINFTNFVG